MTLRFRSLRSFSFALTALGWLGACASAPATPSSGSPNGGLPSGGAASAGFGGVTTGGSSQGGASGGAAGGTTGGNAGNAGDTSLAGSGGASGGTTMMSGGTGGAPEISMEEPVNGLPVLGTAMVDETKPGIAVPSNFLGLSLEWSTGMTYLGDGSGKPYPQTLGLLQNFAAYAERVDFRMGGNSTDKSWWTPGPGTRPAKAIDDVGQPFLDTFAAIQQATGAHFILGANLGANDVTNPSAFVTAALAALPGDALTAIEIGNEPDLYANNGQRAADYGYSTYQNEATTYLNAFYPLVGSKPLLTMPAYASTGWFNETKPFLTAQKSKLAVVTLHHYPFSICGKAPGDASYPTAAQLITDGGTQNVENTYAPLVSAVNALGLGLRMAEFNSIACGGAPGVSDTFAQALWSIDVLFRLARSNAIGVNFHTSQDYPAYRYNVGALQVLPLYYGMLFFGAATAQGGKLIPVTVQGSGRIRSFATLGTDGSVRIAAINEDTTATGKLTVTLTGAHGVARISRLTASSLTAKDGLSFEGRTFDGSTDGKPVGTRARNTVTPTGTSYGFGLPPLSAALLEIPAK